MRHHNGHRHRLKKRFLESLGSDFYDHELVELLLFYAIPRRNTNEIAHRLVERFGSLNKMAEASVDELKNVDGVGESSAFLIKMILTFAKRYIEERNKTIKRVTRIDDAVHLANSNILGARDEMLYAVTLDNSLNVIDMTIVAVGAIDEVKPIVRTVLEVCVVKRATAVLLCHNHPRSGVEPSSADIDFTRLLERELAMVGIHLVEHIITDGIGYNPILKDIRAVDEIRTHIDIDKFYS